ncbi:MAG: hypothetical protein MJ188_07785 [Treponema sp.]|nr:hypothetical protein [Treponema sp.]
MISTTSKNKVVKKTNYFECVHLTDYKERQLLFRFDVYDDFEINEENPYTVLGLQDIINNHIADFEDSDKLRTYLVFDTSTQKKQLVCVFCLKSGDMILGTQGAVPSVELVYFALEKGYKETHSELKGLGNYIFNDFIIYLVEQIYTLAGGVFLYLFAINNKKLVKFYESLGFTPLSDEEENIILSNAANEGNRDCKFLFLRLADYL